MSDVLRKRVQGRLDALGINAFEAAKRGGLTRNFFYELFRMENGKYKKDRFNLKHLEAAAFALDCDPEYLTLEQRTPRRGGLPDGKTISGIAEAGALRSAGAGIPKGLTAFIEPDPRYPTKSQEIYQVRGGHAAGLNIPSEAFVLTANREALKGAGRELIAGDIVVVSREAVEGMSEITVRKISFDSTGIRFVAQPDEGNIEALSASDNVKVLGLVLQAIVVF
ncbi:helix-turn-helix transcriptional regulator [Brucella intermedia]|uniref:helix-turn-helix domain-containing protein n=1 Tax=Brucella TaxID=234 RepID=UPI0009462226|nr:helix-turn-helix transcriptional regulator [Brucella intermedia]